jgi:hypothetical protein
VISLLEHTAGLPLGGFFKSQETNDTAFGPTSAVPGAQSKHQAHPITVSVSQDLRYVMLRSLEVDFFLICTFTPQDKKIQPLGVVFDSAHHHHNPGLISSPLLWAPGDRAVAALPGQQQIDSWLHSAPHSTAPEGHRFLKGGDSALPHWALDAGLRWQIWAALQLWLFLNSAFCPCGDWCNGRECCFCRMH